MLDLQPATGPRRESHGRFGLALAGGGPLGAFYEVGCLHAIEEAFDGFRLTELEMYVGVSSGSMIAAALANGFDTADMGLVFIHNASNEMQFSPALFLMPAVREYAKRLASAPGLLAGIAREYLRDPGMNWAEMIDPLGRLLPTGICDNRPLERVMAQLLSSDGRTNDFRQLVPRLYVVASELNTGHSVRFGEPGLDHVPISRAIQASTALPGLYPPVAIDGHVYADGALLRTRRCTASRPAAPGLRSGSRNRCPLRAPCAACPPRAGSASCAPRCRAAKSSGCGRSAARCLRRRDWQAPRPRTGGAARCGCARALRCR